MMTPFYLPQNAPYLQKQINISPGLPQREIQTANPYYFRNSPNLNSSSIGLNNSSPQIVRIRSITNMNKPEAISESVQNIQSIQKKQQFNIPQASHNQGKKVLILDLDETLIHSIFTHDGGSYDAKFKLSDQEEFFVKYRPKVMQFLRKMKDKYEIFIWTASLKEYANPIIDSLDSKNNIISFRLYRENCRMSSDGTFLKDLSKIPRNLKDIIIVDNLKSCFQLHVENGIQIPDFTIDQSDSELTKLEPLLNFLSDIYDVRDIRSLQAKFKEGMPFIYLNMQGKESVFQIERFKSEISQQQIMRTESAKLSPSQKPMESNYSPQVRISNPYQFAKNINGVQKVPYKNANEDLKVTKITNPSNIQNDTPLQFKGISLLKNSIVNTSENSKNLNNSYRQASNQQASSLSQQFNLSLQKATQNKLDSNIKLSPQENTLLKSNYQTSQTMDEVPQKYTDRYQISDFSSYQSSYQVPKFLQFPNHNNQQSLSLKAEISQFPKQQQQQQKQPFLIEKTDRSPLNSSPEFQPSKNVQLVYQPQISDSPIKNTRNKIQANNAKIVSQDAYQSPVSNSKRERDRPLGFTPSTQGDSSKFQMNSGQSNSSSRFDNSLPHQKDNYYIVPLNKVSCFADKVQAELRGQVQNQTRQLPSRSYTVSTIR